MLNGLSVNLTVAFLWLQTSPKSPLTQALFRRELAKLVWENESYFLLLFRNILRRYVFHFGSPSPVLKYNMYQDSKL